MNWGNALKLIKGNNMGTDFRRLECTGGCCLEKMKHLTEQIFHEQDDLLNTAMAENIELGNFVGDKVLPYLENRAVAGDWAAQDLLVDLSQLVVHRG